MRPGGSRLLAIVVNGSLAGVPALGLLGFVALVEHNPVAHVKHTPIAHVEQNPVALIERLCSSQARAVNACCWCRQYSSLMSSATNPPVRYHQSRSL